MPALYDVQDPRQSANEMLGQSANTYAKRTPEIPEPGKTTGGALQSTMGGTMTGAMLAGAMKGGVSGNPYIVVGGAVLGGLSYLLS